jgi:hypothetical protein
MALREVLFLAEVFRLSLDYAYRIKSASGLQDLRESPPFLAAGSGRAAQFLKPRERCAQRRALGRAFAFTAKRGECPDRLG